jgi:hypothetical protein
VSEPAVAGPQPGPKTAIRSGAVRESFGVLLGERDHAAIQDGGAIVRRDLAEEIRAQASPPARKNRRR